MTSSPPTTFHAFTSLFPELQSLIVREHCDAATQCCFFRTCRLFWFGDGGVDSNVPCDARHRPAPKDIRRAVTRYGHMAYYWMATKNMHLSINHAIIHRHFELAAIIRAEGSFTHCTHTWTLLLFLRFEMDRRHAHKNDSTRSSIECIITEPFASVCTPSAILNFINDGASFSSLNNATAGEVLAGLVLRPDASVIFGSHDIETILPRSCPLVPILSYALVFAIVAGRTALFDAMGCTYIAAGIVRLSSKEYYRLAEYDKTGASLRWLHYHCPPPFDEHPEHRQLTVNINRAAALVAYALQDTDYFAITSTDTESPCECITNEHY